MLRFSRSRQCTATDCLANFCSTENVCCSDSSDDLADVVLLGRVADE